MISNIPPALPGHTLRWPDYLSGGQSVFLSACVGMPISEHWPQRWLRAGQARQIAVLLAWAIEHAPYYAAQRRLAQRLIAAVDADDAEAFWAMWREWPLLGKAELRQNNNQLHAERLPPGHEYTGTHKTSGSTGISVEVRQTQYVAALWDALTLREHLWMRRDFSKRMGVTRFRPHDARHPQGQDYADWGPPVAGCYATGPASVIHAGLDIGYLADWLRRFDPHYLLTYPSIAAGLLQLLGDTPPAALREIRFMSEPLDAELERQLTERWQVRCTDLYSANETGHIAFRCPEAGKLHVQSETILVELIDQHGQTCQPGQEGRVVVTPLHNFATPLIRYDLGDIAVMGQPCACDRQTPVLERVKGRVRNLLQTPDGRRFWPVTDKFQAISAIQQVQYRQTAIDQIEVRLVLSRPLTEPEREIVIGRAKTALGYPFTIDIRAVDQVERGPTGKFEEFLSLLPAN